MSTADSDLETQVVQLAAIPGMSTRKIAGIIGDVSQSTVVRILQRANTGPQAVLREKASSWRPHLTLDTIRAASLALLAVAMTVIAAAVATLAWM